MAPHAQSVPSVLRAIVCALLDDTLSQLVREPTCTGENLLVVLPVPNFPLAPNPHAHKVLSVLTAIQKASVLAPPPDTCAQLVKSPTIAGAVLSEPSPSPFPRPVSYTHLTLPTIYSV